MEASRRWNVLHDVMLQLDCSGLDLTGAHRYRPRCRLLQERELLVLLLQPGGHDLGASGKKREVAGGRGGFRAGIASLKNPSQIPLTSRLHHAHMREPLGAPRGPTGGRRPPQRSATRRGLPLPGSAVLLRRGRFSERERRESLRCEGRVQKQQHAVCGVRPWLCPRRPQLRPVRGSWLDPGGRGGYYRSVLWVCVRRNESIHALS